MKVGIYCRVSTERQKDKESLPTQQKMGIDFCKRNGFDYEVFVEQVSGAKTGDLRKVFTLLEAKLFSKEITAIWFWDWDRMIRDFVEVNFYFHQLVKDTGCKVFVLDREFDIFEDDRDRLEFGMRTLFADYERRKIANRFYVNKIEKWKRGEGFSGQVGYGYKRQEIDGVSRVVVDKEQARIVNDIYKIFLRKDIKHYRQVLDRIWKKYNDGNRIKGLSHTGRIQDILTYETFVTGIYTLTDKDGKEWEFEFGKIIDKEIFDRVQEKRKWITSMRRTNQVYEYLLKGKVRCGDCGSNMVVRGGGTHKHNGGRGKGRYGYYYCGRASRLKYDNYLKKKQNDKEKACISVDNSFNNINTSKLEEIVWVNLHKILLRSDYIKNEYRKKRRANKGLTEDNKGKLVYYHQKLERLEKVRVKVFDDYANGDIEVKDFNDWKRDKYTPQKADIEEQIIKLKKEVNRINKAEKIDDYIELMKIDLQNRFNNERFNHRRAIVEQYLDCVTIKRNKVGNKKSYSIAIKVNFSDKEEGNREGDILDENNDNTIFFTKSTKYEDRGFNKELNFDLDIMVEVDLMGKSNDILYKTVRFEV